MSSMTTRAALIGLLDGLGYEAPLRREDIMPPGAVEALDFVGFTRTAPQDIRTAAIAATDERGRSQSALLGAARQMAAPFALIASADRVLMFSVGSASSGDELLAEFEVSRRVDWELAKFRRALDPAAMQLAKSGVRQLTLFPVDARLLDVARTQAIGSLRSRLEGAFAHVHETRRYTDTEIARLVVSALACVIVRDKYGKGARTPAAMVASALQRHPDYFAHLAQWEATDQATVDLVLKELSEGVDYGAVDARSVNSVYEYLFITPRLRKKLGVFYTPPEFATRILDHLPIEEIPPEARCVVDPACGSGNLLLAAQERLEVLAPGSWSATETHEWLKTHLVGSDIDPIATEIARLSMLLSALPLGNTWRIDTRDFLVEPPAIDPPPTLLVTNPPWHNPKGRRAETASKFLGRSIDLLADGGFLACILPVSWLSGEQHQASRNELTDRCDLFEVWRLPRDMFAPEARMGCAVVFARKGMRSEGRSLAYRWVNAGTSHRSAFVEHGDAVFGSVVGTPKDGQALTWGPLDSFLKTKHSTHLDDVADVLSGVVQRGVVEGGRSSRKRIPMLLRGAENLIYRPVDPAAVTWVDTIENFVATQQRVTALRVAPKLLVQADRFPDNPWRLRPIPDMSGVVPVGVWQAVVPADEETMFALLAVLASSSASCWVHTHATGKRITVDLVRRIPLPTQWSDHVDLLAPLGRDLMSIGPAESVLESLEDAVADAYGLGRKERQAIADLMAGYQAPEGTTRFPERPARESPDTRRDQAPTVRSGTVIAVEDSRIRVWVVGGDDEGELIDLPHLMPGWLCYPGATFDLEGDPATGQYRFQRAAFMTDEEVFGVNLRVSSDR